MANLYNSAAFVSGLFGFLLIVVAIADEQGYLSTNIVGTFTYIDFAFLAVIFIIIGAACSAKAD